MSNPLIVFNINRVISGRLSDDETLKDRVSTDERSSLLKAYLRILAGNGPIQIVSNRVLEYLKEIFGETVLLLQVALRSCDGANANRSAAFFHAGKVDGCNQP